MLRMIRIAAIALGLGASLSAGSARALAEEAEYLRLRPHKEPTTCVEANRGVKCPAVKAPRINKRISTIPGIQHPDNGRPPVISDPLGNRSKAPIQIFGNPGISGN